jgi:hypothetical protein
VDWAFILPSTKMNRSAGIMAFIIDELSAVNILINLLTHS